MCDHVRTHRACVGCMVRHSNAALRQTARSIKSVCASAWTCVRVRLCAHAHLLTAWQVISRIEHNISSVCMPPHECVRARAHAQCACVDCMSDVYCKHQSELHNASLHAQCACVDCISGVYCEASLHAQCACVDCISGVYYEASKRTAQCITVAVAIACMRARVRDRMLACACTRSYACVHFFMRMHARACTCVRSYVFSGDPLAASPSSSTGSAPSAGGSGSGGVTQIFSTTSPMIFCSHATTRQQ